MTNNFSFTKLKGSGFILSQILIWSAVYFVYTYIREIYNYESSSYIVNLLHLVIFILAYFLLKKILIPKFYNKGRLFYFGAGLASCTIIFYAIYIYVWMYYINPNLADEGRIPFFNLQSFIILGIRFYSPSFAILAWESYSGRRKEVERIRELRKEKMQSELKFLKAQINPHFLFNTLNNLYSSVLTGSTHSADMVLKLTGILDYVLLKSQSQRVALKDEVENIKNFIELEQIRYGQRLRVQFEYSNEMSLQISPLILLSLVENAFKHGASGDIDEPEIKIKIMEFDNSIRCNVWNTKSKYIGELNDAYKHGIGLSNTKRQLNLIYPNRHELKIEDKTDSFNVSLKISN